MVDLTNVAYTDEYIKRKNMTIDLAYNSSNKLSEKEVINGNLKRIITEYATREYFCSNNKVYDVENKLVFEYFNVYNHYFFCNRVKYNNGREYIFYKTALYGYNVFSIDTKETFDYYPKHSFNGGETLIGTDIHFNPHNNICAVGGCYWAGPSEIFLIEIDDPLKPFGKYINTHLIIDRAYDKYDDVDFVEWQANDIKIKCYNMETEKNELITITEREYTEQMVEIEK